MLKLLYTLFQRSVWTKTSFTVSILYDSHKIECNIRSGKYWLDSKNQQEIFIQFAQHHGFSAFSADSWYSAHPDTFHSSKVFLITTMLKYHSNTYRRLLALFCNFTMEVIQKRWYTCFLTLG